MIKILHKSIPLITVIIAVGFVIFCAVSYHSKQSPYQSIEDLKDWDRCQLQHLQNKADGVLLHTNPSKEQRERLWELSEHLRALQESLREKTRVKKATKLEKMRIKEAEKDKEKIYDYAYQYLRKQEKEKIRQIKVRMDTLRVGLRFWYRK